MRELVGAVEARLVGIRPSGFDALLAPDDYAPSQNFARRDREDGADRDVYPSGRQPPGGCYAALWPGGHAQPREGRHFRPEPGTVGEGQRWDNLVVVGGGSISKKKKRQQQ